MQFSCQKTDLLFGVQLVANAVSSRNTLPILSNILFDCETGNLHLTGTDLEVSIKCSIPAEIKSEGSLTIPAKRLLDIVRELPEKEVDISSTEKHIVTLRCGKSIFKLNGLPKDEFPILPAVKSEKGFNVPQSMLQDMIRKTIFAVSLDETRYVLNGILLSVEQSTLRMVSTDGHRLALIEKKLEKSSNQTISQIVPAKALHELNKILTAEGEINLQFIDNQIVFSNSKVVLISRLIDGHFPNYEQVIPKSQDKKALCNSALLTAATRRVALMASDKSNSVKYVFSKNNLLITANTPEVGEAQEELEVGYSDESITVAYNAKYVLDVLKNIGSDDCSVELSTNLNPGVFKPADHVENYLCVIMPMRI